MRDLILPLICLLVVSVCICLPAPATVGKTVEPPAVTHVIQKRYVPAPIQWMPAPRIQPELPPVQPRPRCCPNGQCQKYAFPILGAPVRLVGRVVLGVRERIIMSHQMRWHGDRYACDCEQ
jgi:hypothetical protein